MEIFVSNSGLAIALRNVTPCQDGDILLSDDGVTFREATSPGFAGSAVDNTFTIKDPANGAEYPARRVGSIITIREAIFVLDPEARVQYEIPLPHVRVPEYLFRVVNSDTLVYVSCDKYKCDYNSFRLFVGRNGILSELPVISVNRYRDGGTTVIKTASGDLFSPARTRQRQEASWAGQPIERLNPGDFEIHEVDHVVTLGAR